MRTLALLTAAAGALLLAQPAAAQQQTPLNLQQHLECTAMFLIQSHQLTDPEEKGAFEAAVGAMMNRAIPLGEAQGIDSDTLIDRAAGIADEIEGRVNAASTRDAKDQILWNYGPGMAQCISAVLEE